MRSILKKLGKMLDKKDKLFLPVLLGMALLFSFLEMISVGILLPYVELIASPEKAQESLILKHVIAFFPENFEISKIVFNFSFVLIGIYILKLFYSTFFTYTQLKYARNIYNKIVHKLFSKITHQPYMNFIKTNTADYTKALLQEANGTVSIIPSLLIMLSEFLTIILLFTMLVLTDLKMTMIISFFFLGTFILMSQTLTKVIKKFGYNKSHHLGHVYRSLNEGFGNIKILKLNCHEDYGLRKFVDSSKAYNNIQVSFGTLQIMPRNVIEFIGFLAFIIVVIGGVLRGNIAELLPVLTLFAISFYRVMPSISRIMSNYNQIVFYQRCIEIVDEFLYLDTVDEMSEVCSFNRDMVLRGVDFSYLKDQKILSDINVTIAKGSKVGIVGPSGSGKSTLVDILIGLLEINEGEFLVDGVLISKNNVRDWRRKIGYIPQSIYLFDGTVAENVCLGFEYDEEQVKDALKKANILDFLETQDGINTIVGENGIMLSGGQKQRIAIARALYGDPEVLVLDEATSALDHDTEEKIINEIFDIAQNKTVIMVAHRLSSLERCDQIFEVTGGKVDIQEILIKNE